MLLLTKGEYEMSMKQCKKCKQVKELIEFYKHKLTKDGHMGQCKVCNLAQVARWQQQNPDKCREKNERCQLKKTSKEGYKPGKISPEDRQVLFLKQEGRCAICNREESDFNRRLAVDHCHRTGVIRGLLCSPCNRGLGLFRDNPTRLVKASEYIVRNKT